MMAFAHRGHLYSFLIGRVAKLLTFDEIAKLSVIIETFVHLPAPAMIRK